MSLLRPRRSSSCSMLSTFMVPRRTRGALRKPTSHIVSPAPSWMESQVRIRLECSNPFGRSWAQSALTSSIVTCRHSPMPVHARSRSTFR